jgi:parvulin-like peptidyl-prolyl isomerase
VLRYEKSFNQAMLAPNSVCVASADGSELSLQDLILSQKLRRCLRPLLFDALAEKLVLDAARLADLAVGARELQEAADRFRQQHGLTSAERMQQWLATEGLTVDEFEASLERDLLVEKFRRHLAEPGLAAYFAAQHERFTRARLRQIVVASEGQARELLAQIKDEGRDFAELAREHSLDPSARTGGSLGVVLRAGLPPAAADAIFTAREGNAAGPVLTRQGFHLFLVETFLPAELDEVTVGRIRSELFADWQRARLRDFRIHLSWLDSQ